MGEDGAKNYERIMSGKYDKKEAPITNPIVQPTSDIISLNEILKKKTSKFC